jgi:hypothetical protein
VSHANRCRFPTTVGGWAGGLACADGRGGHRRSTLGGCAVVGVRDLWTGIDTSKPGNTATVRGPLRVRVEIMGPGNMNT